MTDKPKCKLCGEPMPEGEEMFFYHGLTGPCPSEPVTQDDGLEAVKAMLKRATVVDVSVRVQNGEFIVTDPEAQELKPGLVRKH